MPAAIQQHLPLQPASETATIGLEHPRRDCDLIDWLALVCYAAGAVLFGRFFYLAPRLRSERIGPQPTKLQRWFPWLPGQFTPAGERLSREMNRLLWVGWVLLLAGLALSTY